MLFFFFFFFSSRRRHTRCYRDWSSDVCSSDLWETAQKRDMPMRVAAYGLAVQRVAERSEERRVGKECRSRWSPNQEKKKKKGGKRREMVGKGKEKLEGGRRGWSER